MPQSSGAIVTRRPLTAAVKGIWQEDATGRSDGRCCQQIISSSVIAGSPLTLPASTNTWQVAQEQRHHTRQAIHPSHARELLPWTTGPLRFNLPLIPASVDDDNL